MKAGNWCLSVLLLSFGVASACAGEQNTPVGLPDALKNLGKYDGRKACWTGRQMEYRVSTDAKGKTETTTTWMALDQKGNVIPEQTFVAIEDQAKRTEAATKADHISGDRGDRSVCGTIKGSQEVTMRVGSEMRKVRVPVLTNITLDVVARPANLN